MRIGYFGPEIPALSQTFVYREILALRRRGHIVSVATVRKPDAPAPGLAELIGEPFVLYDRPFSEFLSDWRSQLFAAPFKTLRIFGLALRDTIASLFEGKPTAKLIYHYFAAFTLAEYWRQTRVEHVHVHFAHFPAQIAMYASRIAGVPWSVMAHANDIYASGLLLKAKAERAKAMVMISAYNKETIAALGAPEEKMPVVRCGVSAPPRTREAPEHRARPFVVGSLGRLVEKKGMDTTIRSFADLKKGGLDVRLEIVGDGPLMEILEREIEENDLGDMVTMKGAMPNDAVQAWLQTLHVFCLACQRDADGDIDGIPVALMEAMALGGPVISTDISGVPELVVHEQSGLICPPRDAKAVALAIRRYYDDADFYAAMQAGALAHIAAEFSENVNIKRLEAIFAGGSVDT